MEEQRSQSPGSPTRVSQRLGVEEGCIARRMQLDFHHGLLGAAACALLASFAFATGAGAETVTLAWDPNTEADLAGYIVLYGTQAGDYTTRIDVGNATTYRFQNLVVGHRYYFAVLAYSTSGLESEPSNEVELDLTDHEDDHGDVPPPSSWVGVGGGSASGGASWRGIGRATGPSQVVPNSLAPLALVDLNGDGRDDVFLYGPHSGLWRAEFTDGRGFSYRGGEWSSGWHVVSANLNGDLLADLFLYDPQSGTWFQKLNTGSGNFADFRGVWSPAWQVHTGDFNGDRLDDVFLYNPLTGTWLQCLANGVGGFITYGSGQWSPDWQVRTAELNGDALIDVFLYNPDTGQWFKCFTRGTGQFTYEGGRWSSGWSITAGDFSGDDRDDLFLYNAVSGLWFLCVTPPAALGFTYYGGAWSPAWQIIMTGDLDGDRRADLLLYNAQTGVYVRCVTLSPGQFDYQPGQWTPDWEVVGRR